MVLLRFYHGIIRGLMMKSFRFACLLPPYFFVLMFVSTTHSEAPCAWTHPGIMINSGIFRHDAYNLFFDGKWDYSSPCSYKWDAEAKLFSKSAIPDNASECMPNHIDKSDYDEQTVTYRMTLNLERMIMQRDDLVFTLEGYKSEKELRISDEPIQFEAIGVPVAVQFRDDRLTLISAKAFDGRDWVLIFMSQSNSCFMLQTDWAIMSSAVCDDDSVFLGFRQYDDVEGCETYGSPGLIRCRRINGEWEISKIAGPSNLDFEVLHMAVWNRMLFVATRNGICVTGDYVVWNEFYVKAILSSNLVTRPRYYLCIWNPEAQDPLDYQIVIGEIDIDPVAIRPDVKILKTNGPLDVSKEHMYCIDQAVDLYWRPDPGRKAQSYGYFNEMGAHYLTVDFWTLCISFWSGVEEESKVYDLLWRIEGMDMRFQMIAVDERWFKVRVPFCWLPDRYFKVELSRSVNS